MSSAVDLSADEQQCLAGLEDDRTIFRHPKDREHPYVMVAKAAVFDNRVSPTARCLLVAMLCMPDDWDFNVRHLADLLATSKSSIARWIQELMDAGYVVRDQSRRRGQFSKARYLVFERPTAPVSTVSQNTVTVKTVHGETVHGEMGHTDTPDPETEYRQTDLTARDHTPAEEKPDDNHLPPHMQLAVTWYKRLAKKTGKLIAPSGDDFLAAQKAVDRADPPTLLALIEPYFAGDWWFTKHKVTKRPTYAFKSFLAHFTEMLEAAPAKGTGPPRGERRCPACNQVLLFGTGRFTRCRCGKAWEIGDDGELEDVSREGAQ